MNIIKLNKNVKISFIFKSLFGLSQGIILVVFNLYLVELGIPVDIVGTILSANPLALAIGSIPVGYLTEIIGFKKSFFFIYGVSGLTLLLQTISPRVEFIYIFAFIGGLALSGDFIANLTFLAQNTHEKDRSKIYSLSSLFFNLSISIGSLVAVIVPNIFLNSNIPLMIAYRLTLVISGCLQISAIFPSFQISQSMSNRFQIIDFKPYLHGMNSFTFKQIIILLCLGISWGMLNPFMNLYFINHLGSNREFFGTISAFTIVFITVAIIIGPLLVTRWRSVPVVTFARFVIVIFLIGFTFTSNLMIGSISYWIMLSIFQMSQPLSLAFAIKASTRKAMTAITSWINVSFWLGYAIAAPIVGHFMFKSNYRYPLFIAIITMVLAAFFNQIFFNRIEKTIKKKQKQEVPR